MKKSNSFYYSLSTFCLQAEYKVHFPLQNHPLENFFLFTVVEKMKVIRVSILKLDPGYS